MIHTPATPLLQHSMASTKTSQSTQLASSLLSHAKLNVEDIIGAVAQANGSLSLSLCERVKAGRPRTLRTANIEAATVNQLGCGSSADVAGELSSTGKRKMLIIINPVSGVKNGVNLWRQRCAPILAAADVELVEIITTGTAHATELVQNLSKEDMQSYDGIVGVGGDGILYEIIAGFMKRDDWLKSMQETPLAIIPAGSGNGLALSILHRKGETRDVESMAYLIARGEVSPMDVCSVDSTNHQTISFLSTEWALASDIDITSEKYRCCGNFRFTCRGIELVFCDGCVRNYRGTLHYLPADASDDGVETGGSKDSTSDSTSASTSASSTDVEAQTTLHGLRTLLPPIADPIGEELRAQGWKTIVGVDWQYFIAMQTTHQAADMFGAPGAELDDGVILLCYGKNVSCAPCTMTSWLCNMEDGSHLNMEACQTLRARAFRLEPEGGIVAVDGERVALEPTQVEAHKGLMRIFC